MVVQSASRVRAVALRSSAFSFAKACVRGSAPNRVQVRRVGREVEQVGAGGPDGFADTGDLVGCEVIEDHDVALGQDRHEELPDIGEEGPTGHGTVQHERGDQAGAAQPRDEGGGAPVAVRCGVDQALAPRPPAVAADHVRGGAGLIQDDEALGVHIARPDPPVAPMLGHIGVRGSASNPARQPSAAFFV
jgi:hypothetical protein